MRGGDCGGRDAGGGGDEGRGLKGMQGGDYGERDAGRGLEKGM